MDNTVSNAMVLRGAKAIYSGTGDPDTFNGEVEPTALRDARVVLESMKAAEQPSDDYCGIVQMSEEDTRVSPADEVERVKAAMQPIKDAHDLSVCAGTSDGKLLDRLAVAALSAIKGQQSTVDEVELRKAAQAVVNAWQGDSSLTFVGTVRNLRNALSAIRNDDAA